MIPSLDDLASDPLTHRYGDLFNPPGLTNFWGCTGVAMDVSALTHISFPPFSAGETVTAGFRLNQRLFASLGAPITFQWFPDRIERQSVVDGWQFRSTTIIPMETKAVVVRVEVENGADRPRDCTLGWSFEGGITQANRKWESAVPPRELDNRIAPAGFRGGFVHHAVHSDAAVVQGVHPPPDHAENGRVTFHATFAPRQRRTYDLIWSVDEDAQRARQGYERLHARIDTLFAEVHRSWQDELVAMFTPNNGRYSGHLPELSIDNPAVQKIYGLGALGLAYFRRDSPYSQVGRTYDTLMPRYWPSAMVLWDYSLSGLAHALLDPQVMRQTLERWMRTDVHTHFGTCYLTGEPIGPWYAVNDYAMASMIHQYVSWQGDDAWLGSTIQRGKTVMDYAHEYATNWRQFRQTSGLAGYGGLFNLLECVSSYEHEVASLNAANVRIMRDTAGLLEVQGRGQEADELRQAASEVVAGLQQLYAPQLGCWNVRNRDQQLAPVRHAYDLLTVLNCIPEDLTDEQRSEMTAFFVRELRTATWMRALSARDDDVLFSLRPDHQWNGAYPAWPPETVKGLCRIGESKLAFDWLQGLARSANQGPFGQAHFVDTAVPSEAGGAAKASGDCPYINDWHSSSSGSWISAVLEGLFGLRTGKAGELTSNPCEEALDCGATLDHLPFQNKLYRVDGDGVHLQ